MNYSITFDAIGHIETKYAERPGTPAQGQNANHSQGTIVIREKYLEGANGLKVGDQVTVIFNFHKSKSYELTTIPYRSKEPTGVFCTRSPDRPNGVGITVVKIININGNRIDFTGADMLNGTPIIDIKPAMRPVTSLKG